MWRLQIERLEAGNMLGIEKQVAGDSDGGLGRPIGAGREVYLWPRDRSKIASCGWGVENLKATIQCKLEAKTPAAGWRTQWEETGELLNWRADGLRTEPKIWRQKEGKKKPKDVGLRCAGKGSLGKGGTDSPALGKMELVSTRPPRKVLSRQLETWVPLHRGQS